MNNDFFPPLGRVAIVDDKFKEVDKLIKFLSTHSIPYLYYSGKLNEFPKPENRKTIQFIFLDLLINGSNNAKNLVSTLISNVDALISDTNGPYTLAIWSQNYKNNEVIINEAIENLRNKPESWFYLDKASLIDSEKFNKDILDKINISYNKNSLVNLSNVCVDHFQSSLAKSFYSFNNSILKNIEGNKKISALLDYVLKDEYTSIEHLTKKERLTLFLPLFEHLIACCPSDCKPIDFGIRANFLHKSKNQDVDICSYNTIMHKFKSFTTNEPRNVYVAGKTSENIAEIIKHYKGIKINEIIPIEIDISHLCSIARKKTDFRTVVSGFLLGFESKYSKDKQLKNVPKSINDYTFYVGSLNHNNKNYHLIIRCDKVTSKSPRQLHCKKALFAISTKWYRLIRFAVSYYMGKVG